MHKLRLLTVSLLLSPCLLAQCEVAFTGDGGPYGFDNAAFCSVLWDPDGPGPQGELPVFGGRFSVAGGEEAYSVAMYDPVNGVWSALGAGLRGTQSRRVAALAVGPNGDLYAGGSFN